MHGRLPGAETRRQTSGLCPYPPRPLALLQPKWLVNSPSSLLQIGLGLVLATLLTWRQQLHAAYELAVQQAQQSDEDAMEAREELLRSPYVRVCDPALKLAGVYGTWAVPVALAGLFAFIAALAMQPGADQ